MPWPSSTLPAVWSKPSSARGWRTRFILTGMAVEIDASTLYEPDALLRCGPPPSADVVKLNDPVIVVEVLSPSTYGRDNGSKLINYFRLPCCITT